ncbi:DNA repair protein RecN [Pseudoclavibacter sp. CFCC 11306]|uniref:DNA repair protein RecN n=1 Tax=Pseudoclavibacter sp. CFCC 11306 TaxID=1564493 RepID=UPI001300E56E|nr:DNA repair protein RecN [Pseudoclavibacter sp. CFCC 11306]KAB1658070.1 DNA repair protein RecN [Pseudoclavibacter sp. CFCC 11306]
MIDEVRIDDLGVVESATLALGAGLTVITGETGAGKTMVVTALQLLQGARADASRVRAGADRAEVSGLLQVSSESDVAQAVEDAGGEIDDGDLIVTRRLAATGRTRAWLGGHAVPNGVLADTIGQLVSIHGQSDQLRLRTAAQQRDVLDAFGGRELRATAEAFHDAYRRWRDLDRRARALADDAEARRAEADRLREEIEAVEAVSPQPGELDQIEARVARLDARQDLLRRAGDARQRLSADIDAVAGPQDVLGLLSGARADLESAGDPDLSDLATRLHEVEAMTQDLSGDLSSYIAALDDVGDGELAAAHERLDTLRDLERRFGSLDEAIALLNDGSARLAELDADGDTREQLAVALAEALDQRDLTARRLSDIRRSAAQRLSEEVTGELGSLAMRDAAFAVQVTPCAVDATGADEVAFLLAAHAGADPLPLARSASGGELSRVMLALELRLAASGDLADRTFVFDEVDSGVGGAAAVQIGQRLARLARHAQVLVVTHLPQVAAYADTHLVVTKVGDERVTTSDVVRLDGEQRVHELARMLAGRVSDTALAHAHELLEQSRLEAE